MIRYTFYPVFVSLLYAGLVLFSSGVRLSGLDDGGPLSSSQPTLSAFLSARRTAQCPICQKTLESSSPEFVNAYVDTCLGEQEPGEVQQSASDGTDL